MFESLDTDREGKIDAAELARALEHYKYVNLTSSFSFTNECSSQSTYWPARPGQVGNEVR
jgi:hypothetical protein